MAHLGRRGQGESLIKLLVVAIIAVIAIAVAKSYFRESSRKTQQTVEEIFSTPSVIPGAPALVRTALSLGSPAVSALSGPSAMAVQPVLPEGSSVSA